MTLLWGLLGAAAFSLSLLLVPFRIYVRLAYPGVSEAEVTLFGLALSRWSSLHGAPAEEKPPAGKAPGQGMQPILYLKAFGAFLAALKRAPVRGLRLTAGGSSGDPAVTAVLYGAAWSMLGTFLSAKGLRPAAVRIEPRLEGPAEFSADGEAAVYVTPISLLRGALRALLVLVRGRRRRGGRSLTQPAPKIQRD